MISIRNLSFSYPGSEKVVLNSVDLTIQVGSLFGLLGPNGAGKTTLISLLTGIYRVKKDTITIDGLDLFSNLQQIKKISGYVPQEYAFYPNLTAQENLHFFAGVQGLSSQKSRRQIEFCLEFCQIQDFSSEKVSTFSGGLKRRLNIAIGLLTDPRIIYFDEPTVGIDPQSRAFILDKIKSLQMQGKTIIYTSHYMEEVEKLCGYVAIIDNGKICLQNALSDIQSENAGQLEILLERPLGGIEKEKLLFSFAMIENDKKLTFENIDSLEKTNAVITMLASMNIEVKKINYGKNDLEDLFMSITKRELRD